MMQHKGMMANQKLTNTEIRFTLTQVIAAAFVAAVAVIELVEWIAA